MLADNLKALFQPLKVGDATLRNRVMMAPMGTGLGTAGGEVTDQMIAYYAARARGGTGALDVEMSAVDYPTGYVAPHLLRSDQDSFIPGLTRLARAIKSEGAVAFIQISHGGRYCRFADTGVQAVAPSAIASRYTGEMPRELATTETEAIIEKFGEAAHRVKEAGFNGVELVANSGYLISQFLSGLTNKRTDRFGGDVAGRATFLVEIIRAIRRRAGISWPVCLKLSVNEYMPGGNTTADSQVIARLAVDAGVSLVHAWAGWHESPIAMLPMSVPRGAFVSLAEAMKQVVDIPVAAAGRINDPVLANSIVSEGKADLVAMGRAFLADPDFPVKASKGDLAGIRKCTACCACFDVMMEAREGGKGHGVVVCAVNAEVGREAEMALKPVSVAKKVLVVGGGPAGMEAARVAALRGHHVTLRDSGERLGGNLLVATVPPYKQELECLLEYLRNQIERLGMKVERGKIIGAQDIANERFDEIIVATGSRPLIPDMPGIKSPKVTTAVEVLRGKPTGQRVLVIGGGMIGCETAEFLHNQGKVVSLIEMLLIIAQDIGPTTRWVVIKRIKDSGIEVLTSTTFLGVTETGAVVERDGKKAELQADTIVIAMGMAPETKLSDELNKLGIQSHTIGDCAGVAKIMEAVHAGWNVGCKI